VAFVLILSLIVPMRSLTQNMNKLARWDWGGGVLGQAIDLLHEAFIKFRINLKFFTVVFGLQCTDERRKGMPLDLSNLLIEYLSLMNLCLKFSGQPKSATARLLNSATLLLQVLLQRD